LERDVMSRIRSLNQPHIFIELSNEKVLSCPNCD
jgi:uncharacterized Zn-finger protein